MRAKHVMLVIMVVAAMVAGGCGGGAAAPSASKDAGKSSGLSKTVDGVKVDVALTPSPPQASQPTQAEVKLTNAQGQPITDARVVVNLNSMGMSMAPIIAQAQPKGNGVYGATLKAAGHGGAHSLTVDVEAQGKTYQAKFDGINIR